MWLLVAGRDRFAEVYSQSTLRRATGLKLDGRVICAACSLKFCFIGLSTREIQVFDNKSWELVRRVKVMQSATCMDVI